LINAVLLQNMAARKVTRLQDALYEAERDLAAARRSTSAAHTALDEGWLRFEDDGLVALSIDGKEWR
jgi:hypothetical protein